MGMGKSGGMGQSGGGIGSLLGMLMQGGFGQQQRFGAPQMGSMNGMGQQQPMDPRMMQTTGVYDMAAQDRLRAQMGGGFQGSGLAQNLSLGEALSGGGIRQNVGNTGNLGGMGSIASRFGGPVASSGQLQGGQMNPALTMTTGLYDKARQDALRAQFQGSGIG